MQTASYQAGIDIGSTTVKTVIYDGAGQLVFARYARHHAQTDQALRALLEEAQANLGDIPLDLAVTGSAGLGLAASYDLPFVQEVVASSRLIHKRWPQVKTLIEIGGEDSKVVFFDELNQPDMRMNGSCAGGTGAFIDQMASLLSVSLADFEQLARTSSRTYPIASRCGVFAKTDIQSLLSNNVPKSDIAASVLHAIALQVAATLFRGKQVEKQVLFAGGPLSFSAELRRAFMQILKLEPGDVVQSERPELIAASGAALCHGDCADTIRLSALLTRLASARPATAPSPKLPPLFSSDAELAAWQARHQSQTVARVSVTELDHKPCFLGIDSGSTTTKMVLTDDEDRLALSYYAANNGDPVAAVRAGLKDFAASLTQAQVAPTICRTAVTGYGEELIKAAFGLDDGLVETTAHFRAAQHFVPEVSFIMDIGGQDMKAIFIENQAVVDIQINEACSSGCGSFIAGFANSLNCELEHFAQLACHCAAPFDLGTRCTVFMNSKIKQAQSEGASVAEISAGLAYAVIKNSLHKVLKLTDVTVLGQNIVVQGGTFRNPAVLRAFEILTGQQVIRPDIAELMGAYGAALTAKAKHALAPATASSFVGFAAGATVLNAPAEILHCKGCENVCQISRLRFPNGRSYFTGNRCESRFGNRDHGELKRQNLVKAKSKLLFERPLTPPGPPLLTFGLPRGLNMYEDLPFWCGYLTACGFAVTLSAQSDSALFEKGVQSVMSDNICFPGKLLHGHIVDLLERGVDRIFYPNVIYGQTEHAAASNSYNCPVVTGYPDVIRSAINPQANYGIPLDSPTISFKDVRLLQRQLYSFVRQFGVRPARAAWAFKQALKAQQDYKHRVRQLGAELIAQAQKDDQPIAVLCGRPYHLDPLINHGIPELLTDLGVHVITEDALPLDPGAALNHCGVLTQWAYSNRILAAAEYVSRQENMHLVQLTSFGCGVDAVSLAEIKTILDRAGRSHALIKIDEIANLGAVKIRLRSFLENAARRDPAEPLTELRPTAAEQPKQFIVPWVSPLYSPIIAPMLATYGCRVALLAPPDRASVELGLTYVNNDICYPAAIMIGDVIKAFKSGLYDPNQTVVILSQTFGQCRASNYLPLMKKALQAAGYGTASVLSFSVSEADLLQSELPINQRGLVRNVALALIFADALARLYHAVAPRAFDRDAVTLLHQRYLDETIQLATRGDFQAMLQLLKAAIAEFNKLETNPAPLPVVGLLGEIYVRFNAFANNNIMAWLWDQGMEVMVPPLLDFFTQDFINERFGQSAHLKRSLKDRVVYDLLDHYIKLHTQQVEAAMRAFRYNRPAHDLKQLAHQARPTVSLANTAGEGWLLTAEMIAMLESGVTDIVCMQPFGCLPNHITGKGVSQSLKHRYPAANILFLDLDAGHSEINLLNRLHCMVMAAKEQKQAS